MTGMIGSPGLEESRDMSLSRPETRTGRAQDREIDKDWRVLCQPLASLFEGGDGVDELNVPGSNWERLPGWD